MNQKAKDGKLIDELKEMAMHNDWAVDENLTIQRVPGGWNYKYHSDKYDLLVAAVFVPMPKSLTKEY